MDEVAFSIIVPCYNVENYVVHCVEKLQQQTFKDMEIILIDDGSTDHTFALCKELAKKYDNVISITHDYSEQEATRNRGQEATRNRGLEATRNRGLEATRGKWVCFLDADDELEDDALQRARETFERHPEIDFILTGLAYFHENGRPERTDIAGLPEGIYTAKEIAASALSEIPWPVMSCVGSKIYKREFIERNGMRFDIQYKFNEDGAFAINAFRKARKIAHLPAPMYRYLQRSGSIMHSYRPNAYASLNRVNALLSDYFKSYGILPQKETLIVSRKWQLMQSLLMEEAAYKDYKSFTALFESLRSGEDAATVCGDASYVSGLTAFSRWMLRLFRGHMRLLLYGTIKVRGVLIALRSKKA